MKKRRRAKFPQEIKNQLSTSPWPRDFDLIVKIAKAESKKMSELGRQLIEEALLAPKYNKYRDES